MTFPPEDRREPFRRRNKSGWDEVGFLVPGACGRPHIEGPSFDGWWRCPNCQSMHLPLKRARTTRRLQARTKQMLDLFYPTKETR